MTTGRLVRLELRRNAMIWMLPVVAVLFWLLTYRPVVALPPMWNVRAMTMQGTTVAVFLPTVAGAAAWTVSRERRRGLTDLLAGTPRTPWSRHVAVWAATTGWGRLAGLGGVGAVYGVTAGQKAWGGPLWWPAIVALASVPAIAALGTTAGVLVPSRFTPPLVAIGAFVGLEAGLQLIHGDRSAWQVLPLIAGPWELGPSNSAAAIYYPYLPDLPIAQLFFLAGVTATLLGLLGLPAEAGGRWLRRSAAVAAAAGLLTAGTAAALAGTGRLDPHGLIRIPAWHNPADDRPVPYTPVCSRTTIPICLHPAYATYLPAVADALAPVLDEVAGLPGAPVRVSQQAVSYQESADDGVEVERADSAYRAGVFFFVLPGQGTGPALTRGETAAQSRTTIGRDVVRGVIGGESTPAQRAVEAALLHEPADPAARRFAALPAEQRRAWLVAHLAELRAGRVALEQLP